MSFIDLVVKYLTWYDQIIINKGSLFDTSIVLTPSKEELTKLRYTAFSHPESVRAYIDDNPYGLNDQDLNASLTLTHAIVGRFVITSSLKDSMLLLHTSPNNERYLLKVYPQKDDFLDYLKMIGLPRLVETVLFPFDDRIIYDTLSLLNITFGGSYRSSITADVKEAKAKYGIITTLPILKSTEDSDLVTLRGYSTNKQSIDDNWADIWLILDRKPEYIPVFYQRMGETYTRIRRKELKEEGIESGWFALLGRKVIAGGKSREIVEEAALGIVPPNKKDCIYYFQVQEKKKGR